MFDKDQLQEKCAVFGVYSDSLEAARLVHLGLWALQHRGQESSGIASSTGKKIYTHCGAGLVAHVYSEPDLKALKGHIAIGHNRYSTSGGGDGHCQPIYNPGGAIALAHNGNLPSTSALKKWLKTKHLDPSSFNDSEMMHLAISLFMLEGQTVEQAIISAYPLFTGVFSLVIMTKNKLIAVRDSCGVRPLSIGQVKNGYVVSSETCALDAIGSTFVRDVAPGEMVVIDKNGLTASQIVPGTQKLDIFEFIYFARPDSQLLGQSVNTVRQSLGRQLAREHSIKADIVIPVPDSAIPAAIGFSQASGTPFDHGFVKNRYIHRTFIRPAQSLRETDVSLKLNPLPGVLNGKEVVIIDDSIVRGTTSKKIVAMVRKAGATKVHLLISSPPVLYPDFYGINTPRQSDLLAAKMTHQELVDFTGADSVRYLSYDGMIKATGLPESALCTSCFSGVYPVDIGPRAKSVKKIERHSKTTDHQPTTKTSSSSPQYVAI